MNKRLVIMFSAIAAVIVIVVVCCVLFMVGSVGVETVIGLELTDEQEAGVIAVSGISKGQSVFSIDESAAANAIEKAYPTLAVVTIERIFPNKVDIKLASRTGVAAVEIADADHYAVVDRDLKIVGFAAGEELDAKSLSLVEGYVVSGSDEQLLGAFLDTEKAGWLAEVIDGAEQCRLTGVRLGEFAPRIVYIQGEEGQGAGMVTVVTVPGCDLVLPLGGDVSEHFVGAYSALDARFTHEGGPLDTDGTLRLGEDGWVFTPAA